MIIPIRCTCKKLISTKYLTYKERVAALKKKQNIPIEDSIINVMSTDVEKTIEGKVMDELGIINLCCRKIFLGHIDYD